MLIHRSQDAQWLANAYVIADEATQRAIWIDCNGDHDDLHRFVAEHGLTVEGILLTHHHADHIEGLDEIRARYGVPVAASARCIELIRADGSYTGPIERVLGETEEFDLAGMAVRCIPTPGHAGGHLAYLVNGADVFTGDVLFRGTVGGTRAPGHTDLADLRASLDRLLALPDATVVHPGHTLPTTIAAERSDNVFLRHFRGEEPALDEAVTAWGEPATLLVFGPDYDGGHKALVRWANGAEDIVGGSRVERA